MRGEPAYESGTASVAGREPARDGVNRHRDRAGVLAVEHAPDAAVRDARRSRRGRRRVIAARRTLKGPQPALTRVAAAGAAGDPTATAAERDRAGVESRRRRHVAQEHIGVLEAIVAHERLGTSTRRRRSGRCRRPWPAGSRCRRAPVPGDRDQDRVGEHDVALVDLGLGRCHGSEMGVGPQGRWAQQVGRRRLERHHPPVGRDRRQAALAPRGLAARRHRDEDRLARGESRRKTSGAPLPSFATRFGAADSNATTLPSAEIAGAPDAPFGAPPGATLTWRGRPPPIARTYTCGPDPVFVWVMTSPPSDT